MSKGAHTPELVVEWSPGRVSAFDPFTRSIKSAPTLAGLGDVLSAGRTIVVAVSRRSAFVRSVRVPDAGAEEVNLILQTQLSNIFPVPLTELSYDFRLTHDVSPEGRLAVVAAMRTSDLNNLHAQAATLGLRIKRVLPASFGSVLLASELHQPDCAVVQQTDEGLAIDIVSGGELRYSRLSVLPGTAAGVDAEIGRTYAAVSLPCGPSIAAGGFVFEEAQIHSTNGTLEFLATHPLDRLEINLEPTEAVQSRIKRRHNQQVRLAVILWAAAIILIAFVYYDRSDAETKQKQAQAVHTAALTRLKGQTKQAQTAVAEAETSRSSLKRAFQPSQRYSDIITTVSNLTPQGMWLTSINIERGKVLNLRGTSVQNEAVSKFLEKLSSEPRLRDPKLVFANNAEIEETSVVQFSLSAFPVGNLPLVDQAKKGAKK